MDIVLFIAYFIIGWDVLLFCALAFLGIILYTWYLESRITNEWKVFKIKKHRSGLFFSFGYFGLDETYYFICQEFERTEHETGISKIVGWTKGLFIHNKLKTINDGLLETKFLVIVFLNIL